MRILVTGGCGYVGSVLVPRLLELGHEVTALDVMWFGNHLAPHPALTVTEMDLRSEAIPALDGVDAVIHLAGIVNDPAVEFSPVLSWETNALATMRLADASARAGVRQFVYASSGSIYGIKDEPEVTEDLPPTPLSAYNKTKMVAERAILSYAGDMLVQILRPGTVCGYSPRMRLDVLVNLLAAQALSKGRITVLGGPQERPQLHMDDMVGAYLHCLAKGEAVQGVFNVGYGNVSVEDVARRIAERIPCELEIRPTNDPRSYRMNSDKLRATGFAYTKTLEHAVDEMRQAWEQGLFQDDDRAYSLRWMKHILGEQGA